MAKRAKSSDHTTKSKEEATNVKPKGQTLRLNPDAWYQLKQIALEKRMTTHTLLIEAVNEIFRSNGRPPIA